MKRIKIIVRTIGVIVLEVISAIIVIKALEHTDNVSTILYFAAYSSVIGIIFGEFIEKTAPEEKGILKFVQLANLCSVSLPLLAFGVSYF